MIAVTNDFNPTELMQFNSDKITEITQFLETECNLVSGAYTSKKTLYIAYKVWCKKNNRYQLRRGELDSILTQLGYRKKVVNGKQGWCDLVPVHVMEVQR